MIALCEYQISRIRELSNRGSHLTRQAQSQANELKSFGEKLSSMDPAKVRDHKAYGRVFNKANQHLSNIQSQFQHASRNYDKAKKYHGMVQNDLRQGRYKISGSKARMGPHSSVLNRSSKSKMRSH